MVKPGQARLELDMFAADVVPVGTELIPQILPGRATGTQGSLYGLRSGYSNKRVTPSRTSKIPTTMIPS